MVEKCIVFDIWGTYGHFRKPYSTNSSLTYFFPPKPTIIGLLAGIAGLEKNSYHHLAQNIIVSIVLKNKKNMHKKIFTLNYVNTKKNYFENSPVNVELLLNPEYRIYVSLKNDEDTALQELFKKLKENISNHKSVYTVSLGSAFCLANFNFIGVFDLELKSGNSVLIHSVIPRDGNKIVIDKDNHVIIENMPHRLNSERKPVEFCDFYGDIKGDGLKVSDTSYYQIGDKNVIFF